MKTIKYFFPTLDGAVFINLPECVSRSTIKIIMLECGFSSCYILVHGIKLFLDI